MSTLRKLLDEKTLDQFTKRTPRDKMITHITTPEEREVMGKEAV